jgi:hypothetical protein
MKMLTKIKINQSKNNSKNNPKKHLQKQIKGKTNEI